jgi:hypothetical protein
VTSRIRTAAVIAGLSSLLVLTACSAAPSGTTTDPGTDPAPQESAAAAPETACPDGFIDAYTAESASLYEPGLSVTEVAVDDFEPAFLAPFLDGGCGIHITGVFVGGGGIPIDADYGFAPDATTADAIAEALEANGYEEDPNYPGGYQSDTGFASVFVIGGEVTVGGQAALEQFYPNGVIFYA